MTVITIILMFGPPTLAQIMGADREIVGKAAYSIMIFCPVLVAETQLLIKKWFRHTNLQKEAEADRKERSRKLSGGSGIILQKSGRAQEEIP